MNLNVIAMLNIVAALIGEWSGVISAYKIRLQFENLYTLVKTSGLVIAEKVRNDQIPALFFTRYFLSCQWSTF